MPLTETRLRALKPKDKPYKVADDRGLYIEVSPSGGKLWRFRYRIGTVEKKLSIGSYPEINLKDARQAAYEARVKVASGGDPAMDKRKQKIRSEFLSAQTFEAVAREYIDEMMVQNGRADATIIKANFFLDQLTDAIGSRPIDEIEPFEVLAPLTHLLELEIARALKPLTLKRLEELHGLSGQRQRPVRNSRSGRIALLVPARSILADDGTRVARFELLRPLKRSHITEDQLAESSWEDVSVDDFRDAWVTEVEEARSSHKRERLYLATGLLLPVWDKLPSDFVRVSRISAADDRSLLGREVPAHCVPDLCQALGLERDQTLSADDIVQTVLATGRAMEFPGREQLMVKRSLVNGSQRLELTGWSAARLDWYKAQGCFTEIIRYQTRIFVPIEGAASVIARLVA